jgi:hypothetical protein
MSVSFAQADNIVGRAMLAANLDLRASDRNLVRNAYIEAILRVAKADRMAADRMEPAPEPIDTGAPDPESERIAAIAETRGTVDHLSRNKYAQPCAVCGKRVSVGEGRIAKIQNIWRTWHDDHVPDALRRAPEAVSADVYVSLVLAPQGMIEVVLSGHLGPKWDAYRAAQSKAGARWDRSTNKTTMRPDQAVVFAQLLMDANILVRIPDDARARMEVDAKRAVGEVAKAEVRIEDIEARLAKRGLVLRDYQKIGIRWLAPRAGAIMADSMRLGKTMQTILAAPEGAPIVAVVPATIKFVWKEEVSTWRPDLKVVVYEGTGSFRWPPPGTMAVINYDILPEPGKSGSPAPGTVLIADEAHYLKGDIKDVARVRQFNGLAVQVRENGGRVWLLTGTPLVNGPRDIFNMLKMAGIEQEGLGGWGGLMDAFGGVKEENRFGTKIKFTRTAMRSDYLARFKSVMLRREPQDVSDELPPRYVETVVVPIDHKAMAGDPLAQMVAETRGGMDAVRDLIDEGKVGFELLSKARSALSAAKVPALQRLLDEYERRGEPVVVVSPFLPAVNIIGKRPGWTSITGATKVDSRGDIIKAFQAGKFKGITGTIKTMGMGISLWHANTIIFLDEDWTPAANEQAAARIFSIAKQDPTYVIRLIADHPIDARVNELLIQKQEYFDGSVSAARRGREEYDTSIPDVASVFKAADAVQARVDDAWHTKIEADKKMRALAEELAQLDRDLRDATSAASRARLQKQKEERFQEQIERAIANRRALARAEAGKPRDAKNDHERWVIDALGQLADADLDHAKYQNEMGFSKSDTSLGHALAALSRAGELTDTGWTQAINMARRYRRQVGTYED